MTRLSLIFPCFNESDNLPRLVEQIANAISEHDDIEIMLVDNGSTDDTLAIMAREIEPYEFIKSTRVEVNQGYGFGILVGLGAASGNLLAWTHADLQTNPVDIIKGLELFDSSSSPENLFVKGARYGRPLKDVTFTWAMAIFESLLLGVRLSDINAQPTMFHRSFFETWHDPPYDFALDLYVYHKAVRDGLSIARFPVRFDLRTSGIGNNETFNSKIKNSLRALKFSFRLRQKFKSPGN